jgi:hypothetical protein
MIYSMIGGIIMKQDYEKPELIVYEDLSDVTQGVPTMSELP